MSHKHDPFREIVTTIVAEAMYQDILITMDAEDTPSMRAVFALLFPDLLEGNPEGILQTMSTLFPGFPNPMAAQDPLTSLLGGQAVPLEDIDDIEGTLEALAGGRDIRVHVVSPDTLGNEVFSGEKGSVIPESLPSEIRETLKALGLVEEDGEVLKDNMPADLSYTVKVKDDVIN